MTFGSTFGRTFSPTFQPHSQAVTAEAGGWWLAGGIPASACVAAYQAKGASSYAASKVNLANPGTYDLTDGAAYPTWDAVNGWTCNGSSQYLNSGIVPLIDQTWSAIIKVKTPFSISNGAPLFSRGGTSKDFGLFLTNVTTFYPHNGKNISITISSIRNADCTLAVVGNRGYKDGAILAGIIPTGTPPTTQPVYIGAGNNNGTAAYFWKGLIYGAAFYKIVLTDAQVQAVHSAMP